MAIPRLTNFDFRFNGGRGVRTDQIDGTFVEDITADGNATVRMPDGTSVQRAVEPVEQRVVLDQPASADTLNKINIHQNEAELTQPTVQGGVPPTAIFADYTNADYLGVQFSDPDASVYNVGQWYFHGLNHRPRVVTDTDPIAAGVQKGWIDATFAELIDPDPNYLGEHPDDASARGAHGVSDSALYYDTTDISLRVVTSFRPGSASSTVYSYKRLITTEDMRSRDESISELEVGRSQTLRELAGIETRLDNIPAAQDLSGIEARIDNLGDLQAVMVASASSYSGTLDSQATSPKPLMLTISVAISGTRAGTAFTWAANDVLYFPPNSVAPEFLLNLGVPADPSSGGSDLNRNQILALIQAQAQAGNTDRWVKSKVPADTVYDADLAAETAALASPNTPNLSLIHI